MIIFWFTGRKNYTLAATWQDGSGVDKDKTLTGCVVGQPVIVLHAWKNADTTIETGHFVFFKVTGATNVSAKQWIRMGFIRDSGNNSFEQLCLVLMPSTTSMTFHFGMEYDSDDIIRIYKT